MVHAITINILKRHLKKLEVKLQAIEDKLRNDPRFRLLDFDRLYKDIDKMNYKELEANLKQREELLLVCGDMETAMKIYESVKEKSNQCKESLQISIENK